MRATSPLVLLALAALTPAQSTVLFFSRYDSTSLDTAAGRLGNASPFGVSAVTPAAGATAHAWIPAGGMSAVLGDPDRDRTTAEFSGLPQARWGLGSPFVKHADKKKGDPRLVYWTIREPITSPPTVTLFNGSGTHVVRVGDWVRVKDNGDAEFFIKREHFVSAMGAQRGNWVEGATCICQAPNGDIYYAPAHAISKNGNVAGGHWVSNGMIQVFANDGAICRIPAADITYDASGNVTAVKAGAGRLVVNETGAGPNGEPSVRDMCKNSGALDRNNNPTLITFMMVGIEIDPNGGKFTGWFEKNVQHPNLIFTFENRDDPCCGGLGSWMSTIFSTSGTPQGSIATINGVQMGATQTGKVDGSWIGIKAGSGDVSAPVIRGLALIDAGFKTVAPYGTSTLQIANRGAVSLGTDPNIRLDVQGAQAPFPSTIFLGLGPAQGGRPATQDVSFLLGGNATLHLMNAGPLQVTAGGGNAKARASFTLPVPNNPFFIGQTILFQAFSFTPSQGLLSNPVPAEFRR